jgi:hypothetical protein
MVMDAGGDESGSQGIALAPDVPKRLRMERETNKNRVKHHALKIFIPVGLEAPAGIFFAKKII